MPTGQGLADLLSGAAGAPVNRPQLNAFVATSQARNGLVSAQTQDAMIKAQQAQEELDAHQKLPQALMDANPGMKPSEAALASTFMIGKFGDAQTSLKALGTGMLGFGTPEQQTSGQQMEQGKVAGPVTTPNTFQQPVAPVGGSALGPIQQSPQGVAQTAATNATAGLHDVQAAAGGFNPNTGGVNRKLDPVTAAEAAEFIKQNPNLAGNFRSLLSNGGPDVIHAFLHPGEAGVSPTAPANGITPAPGVSLKEQADIRNDFAKGTAAKQTTALSTMVLHSQLFDTIADQLDNGNFTPTAHINALWQRLFGNPAPTNLATAGGFLGREAVRATVNAGAGTGAERELAVNENSTSPALHGAAQTLRSLAAGQLQSLDLRAQRGGVDIAQLLVPEARAVFGRQPVAVAAPKGAAGGDNSNVGLHSYPDEASALAAGHHPGDRVIIGGVTGTLQ